MNKILCFIAIIFNVNAYANTCSGFLVKIKSKDGSIQLFSEINKALRHVKKDDKILLGDNHFDENVKINKKHNLILKSNCNATIESLSLLYSDQIKIKNITIDGSSNNKIGIDIKGSSNFIKIKNVTIKNSRKRGISIGATVKKVVVIDSKISNTEGDGVFIHRSNSGRHKIVNSTIENNERNGVVTGENRLRLIGSTVQNNGLGGNKKNGYGLVREASRNKKPRYVRVINSTIINNNGKTVTGKFTSTIDVKNIELISDSKDTGNITTTGVEFPSTENLPVAITSDDLLTQVGAEFSLSAVDSYSLDGENLTYNWVVLRKPLGSSLTLVNSSLPIITTQLDIAGSYEFGLVVKSSTKTSIQDTVIVSTGNIRPKVVANELNKGTIGSPLTVSVENSIDLNNDQLTFKYSIKAKPSNSQAQIISNLDNFSITPDVSGIFEISVIANDGIIDSKPFIVKVYTENVPPSSVVNSSFSSTLGVTFNLTSENSSDFEQSALTTEWALTYAPSGSMNEILNENQTQTEFIPDSNGIYIFQAIVNDGELDSKPATFYVEVKNTIPEASFELPSDLVETKKEVILDGSSSIDINQDPLSFSWTILTKPAGSNINTTGTSSSFSIKPDISGEYKVQLIVSDPYGQSYPVIKTFRANYKPVATIELPTQLELGKNLELKAIASDQDGETLSYLWELSAKPTGSLSPVANKKRANASFIADKAGTYELKLSVSDTNYNEVFSTNLTINAVTNGAPVLVDIPTQMVVLGSELTYQVQASDPEGRGLVYDISPKNLADGMSFNKKTGLIEVETTENSVGIFNYTISVSDGVFSTSKTFTLNIVAPSPNTPTSLSGRVLDTTSHVGSGSIVPIIGARVYFVGTTITTTTDAQGYFDLTNIPVEQGVFYIDTSSAQNAPDGSRYANFGEGIKLIEGASNIHDRPFYIPRVDGSSLTEYVPNQEIIVNNESLGVKATISNTTVVTNPDGSPFVGEISISEVPASVAPVAMPDGVSPALLLTLQPAGIQFSEPIPMTFPNREGLVAGSEVDLYSVNVDTGMFEVVGKGRVTQDESSIVIFDGGISAATWHMVLNPTLNQNSNIANNSNSSSSLSNDVSSCDSKTGGTSSIIDSDPMVTSCSVGSAVDPRYGNLTEKYETVSYKTLDYDRSVSLVYNSNFSLMRPIMNVALSIPVLSAVPDTVLIKPAINNNELGEFSSSTAHLSEDDIESPVINFQVDVKDYETGVYDLIYDIRNLHSFNGNVSSNSTTVNRDFVIINRQNSAFGNGWYLEDLSELHFFNENIYVIEGNGTSIKFERNEQMNNFYEAGSDGNFDTIEFIQDAYLRKTKFGTELYYDLDGKIRKIVGRNKQIYTYEYNADGLISKIKDPVGFETSLIYENLKLKTIIDPLGRETNFVIDSNNELLEITDPDGESKSFNYNELGLMSSQTDRLGNASAYAYSEFGLVSEVINKDGSIRSIVPFFSRGLIPTTPYDVLDTTYFDRYLENETLLQAKKYNKVFNTDEVAQSAVRLEEQAAYFNSAKGGVSKYEYLNGRVTSIESLDSEKVVYERNDEGQVVRELDGNQTVILRTFDEMGNVLTRKNENELNEYRFEYDEFQNISKSINPTGDEVRNIYDDNGDLKERLLPRGNKVFYTRNSKGQMTSKKDILGNIWSYFYHAITGNLIKTIDPKGLTTTFTHDQFGNIISVLDNKGQETQISFDEMNRVTSQTDARGFEIQYFYNAKGELEQLIDERGFGTLFERDELGRVVKEIDRVGAVSEYIYNEEGEITSKVDKNGVMTTFTYDTDGKILQRKTSDEEINYTYTLDNKLQSISNEVATIEYEYEQANNNLKKVSVTDIFRPNEVFSFNYVYDSTATRLVNMFDSRGKNYFYSYNENNQLREVILPNNERLDFAFDKLDRRFFVRYPNTTYRFIDFNSSGNITTFENKLLSTNIATNFYDYDEVDNIKFRRYLSNLPNGLDTVWDYDENNQLNSSNDPSTGTTINYQWDALGNRLTDTGSNFENIFDNQNRLLENSTQIFEYDSAGNTTKVTDKSTNDYRRLYWDGSNRLKSIRTYESNDNWIKTVEYFYGPLGNRLGKRVDDVLVENFVYQGDNIYMVEGTLGERVFVNGVGLDDQMVMIKDGKNYSLHKDHLGSIQAITDETAEVVEQYSYDDFGNMKVYDKDGVEKQISDSGNIFGYTGRDFDNESEFYYYRARYYSPALGRFLSSDPIGFEGGDSNLYRYVGNNSVNFRDPTGKIAFVPILIAPIIIDSVIVTGITLGVIGAIDSIINSNNDDFGEDFSNSPGGQNAPNFNGNGPSPGSELLVKIGITGTVLYGVNQCSSENN